MILRTPILISMAILIMVSTGLYCEVSDEAKPDSAIVNPIVSQLVTSLYNNEYKASFHIDWEILSVNSEDLSDLYWDAVDNEEEDLFFEYIIEEISKLLHYEGDSGDNFIEWKETTLMGNQIITCHNKKKNVEMHFNHNSLGNIFLFDITINDIK